MKPVWNEEEMETPKQEDDDEMLWFEHNDGLCPVLSPNLFHTFEYNLHSSASTHPLLWELYFFISTVLSCVLFFSWGLKKVDLRRGKYKADLL